MENSNNCIVFTGDTFLNSRNGGDCFSKSMKELFSSAQINCINLEAVMADEGEPIQKAFNINTSPQNVRELISNNIKIANISNNHTYDFGEKGFEVMIRLLKSNGILTIGIKGMNTNVVELENGIKVGISGYSNGFGERLAKIDVNSICRDIHKMKDESNYIIVCLHWGEEYSPFPAPYQQNLSRELIEAGADVIISHHPHVMQGYEKYKNGLIFYSLGNFNFHVDHPYHNSLTETRYAYCVKLTFESRGIDYSIIPVYINDEWVPEILDGTKKKVIDEYIECISKPLYKGISNTFFYAHAAKHHFKNNMPAWGKRIREHGSRHFVLMVIWFMRPGNIKFLLGLLLYPFRKKVKLNVSCYE